MAFITPLRYPGGKGRLGNWLRDVIRANKLESYPYIEPFAGGAGAAIFLLTQKCVPRIHINDIDPLITTFWEVLVTKPERLAALVRTASVNLEARDRAKQIVENYASAPALDVAFAVFLLNRTSRSGILSGGPIGGRQQNGRYRLDARYNHEALAQRIEYVGSFRKQITVTRSDAAELLTSMSRRTRQLVYCDPPYYVKGEQLYTNHYTDADHARIAGIMNRLRCPWLVTYDPHPFIDSLYSHSETLSFALHYSTHLTRPKAQERMFFRSLDLPCAPYLHR